MWFILLVPFFIMIVVLENEEKMMKWVVAHTNEKMDRKSMTMTMKIIAMKVIEINEKRTQHHCGNMWQILEEGKRVESLNLFSQIVDKITQVHITM